MKKGKNLKAEQDACLAACFRVQSARFTFNSPEEYKTTLSGWSLK